MNKQIAALATDEENIVMWDIDTLLLDYQGHPHISVDTEAPSMICYIRGDKIYVRAKSFTEENDMIYYLRKRQQNNIVLKIDS